MMKTVLLTIVASLLFSGLILYTIKAINWIGINEQKAVIAQPECPKGLAEQAADLKFKHDQSQFEFESLRKGPR